MKTLDRYIIRLFLLNLVILFLVLVGLIVLLDLIINFDEFVQAAQQVETSGFGRIVQTGAIMVDFYAPMICLFYVYLVGLLPLGAAAFTLTTLIRNRELIAILAGGISMHRIAMPILALGFAANLLLIVDQELILPNLIQKLSRSHSDLKSGGSKEVELQFTPDGSGALFTAPAFHSGPQTIDNLTILRRRPTDGPHFGRAVERITASQASWDDENGGWRLTDGLAARDIEPTADNRGFAARRVYDVNFYPSDLDPITILLRDRARYSQLLSLGQLGELMDKPRIIDTATLQRIQHSRFSLVIVNMLILAMGMSYFLIRVPGNLMIPSMKAAALCVGAWGGGFVLLQFPAGPLPPAAVAWLPVMIYLPVAYYLMDRVET